MVGTEDAASRQATGPVGFVVRGGERAARAEEKCRGSRLGRVPSALTPSPLFLSPSTIQTQDPEITRVALAGLASYLRTKGEDGCGKGGAAAAGDAKRVWAPLRLSTLRRERACKSARRAAPRPRSHPSKPTLRTGIASLPPGFSVRLRTRRDGASKGTNDVVRKKRRGRARTRPAPGPPARLPAGPRTAASPRPTRRGERVTRPGLGGISPPSGAFGWPCGRGGAAASPAIDETLEIHPPLSSSLSLRCTVLLRPLGRAVPVAA